jgi:hypothetical protein
MAGLRSDGFSGRRARPNEKSACQDIASILRRDVGSGIVWHRNHAQISFLGVDISMSNPIETRNVACPALWSYQETEYSTRNQEEQFDVGDPGCKSQKSGHHRKLA